MASHEQFRVSGEDRTSCNADQLPVGYEPVEFVDGTEPDIAIVGRHGEQKVNRAFYEAGLRTDVRRYNDLGHLIAACAGSSSI